MESQADSIFSAVPLKKVNTDNFSRDEGSVPPDLHWVLSEVTGVCRTSASLPLCTSMNNVPFFNHEALLTMPAILSKAFRK
jgi:hypothetical protein